MQISACQRHLLLRVLVSFRFFQNRFTARRQHDGTYTAVLDEYQAVHDRILPHWKMRAAMPAFPCFGITPRPLRDPGQKLPHRKRRRVGRRAICGTALHGALLAKCTSDVLDRPGRNESTRGRVISRAIVETPRARRPDMPYPSGMLTMVLHVDQSKS